MLKNYTTEYLEDELKRRRNIEKFKKSLGKPQLVEALNINTSDWRKVITTSEDVINAVIDGTWDDEYDHIDYATRIFEDVMAALYGKDFWKWYNDYMK